MSTFSVPRYALYFAPAPDSALWRFGSAVLGYDGATGQDVAHLVPPGFELADWRALTLDPRSYGFHATIKAPFRLMEGRTEAELVEALHAFCARQRPFALPRLVVSAIPDKAEKGDAFIALTEPAAAATNALLALERAAVEEFEPFRAPLTDKEFARRRPDALSDRQRACLNAYGYPHVLDDFLFHMTLTGRVPAARVEAARAGLEELYVQHAGRGAVPFDALALYRQDAGESRFHIIDRASFPRS